MILNKRKTKKWLEHFLKKTKHLDLPPEWS